MALPAQTFTCRGNVLQALKQEASKRVMTFRLRQLQRQLPVEFEDFQVPCHRPAAFAEFLQILGRLKGIFFLSDNLAGEVGHRDQPLRTTMLINHHQQGLTTANQGQELRQGSALLHQRHGGDVGSKGSVGTEHAPGNGISKTPQVKHATHVVEGAADYREAGVGGVMDLAHQLGKTHIQGQGDHAGSGHHHLPHQGVPQRKDSLQNVAFVGHQTGDVAGFDQSFKLASRQGRHQLIPVTG